MSLSPSQSKQRCRYSPKFSFSAEIFSFFCIKQWRRRRRSGQNSDSDSPTDSDCDLKLNVVEEEEKEEVELELDISDLKRMFGPSKLLSTIAESEREGFETPSTRSFHLSNSMNDACDGIVVRMTLKEYLTIAAEEKENCQFDTASSQSPCFTPSHSPEGEVILQSSTSDEEDR